MIKMTVFQVMIEYYKFYIQMASFTDEQVKSEHVIERIGG